MLGLLGWLGVALVVAAVAIKIGKPDLQPWSQGLAIAGLVATGLYALSQWRDIVRSFQGRNVRYGTVAAGSVLLFLGILVAINWISGREHKLWDLTAAQQFSLSDQTKQILTDLKKPLSVKVFYGGDAPVEPFKDRFASFQYLNKQISVEYINVERDPMPAQKYDVKQYGTILLEYDGRTEKVTSNEEQDLASALKKLLEGKAKKLYFVQGHGEHDIAGSDRFGYAAAAKNLKDDNFDVATLVLAQEGKVPEDASVVVVAGPKTDYLPAETDILRAYLKRGGKVLLMLDPPEKADGPQPTSLIALAKEWGIDVGNDLVVDLSGVGQAFGTNEAVPIALPSKSGHPIIDRFQVMTAFPLARSVTPIEGGTEGKNAQKLVETSNRSWAETDLKALFTSKKVDFNGDKGDKMGPVSLAAAVSAPAADAPATPPPAPGAPEPPKAESRLVVVGDSDFVSTAAIAIQGNGPLLLNMVNWLAQQENMIAIRQRDPEDRRIQLTEAEGQGIVWLTIAIIPGLLLLNGFRTWWKRR